MPTNARMMDRHATGALVGRSLKDHGKTAQGVNAVGSGQNVGHVAHVMSVAEDVERSARLANPSLCVRTSRLCRRRHRRPCQKVRTHLPGKFWAFPLLF